MRQGPLESGGVLDYMYVRGSNKVVGRTKKVRMAVTDNEDQ